MSCFGRGYLHMGHQGSSTLQGVPWATTEEIAISQVVLCFCGHHVHVLKYKAATLMLCSPLQANCVKSRQYFVTVHQKWYKDFILQAGLIAHRKKSKRQVVL